MEYLINYTIFCHLNDSLYHLVLNLLIIGVNGRPVVPSIPKHCLFTILNYYRIHYSFNKAYMWIQVLLLLVLVIAITTSITDVLFSDICRRIERELCWRLLKHLLLFICYALTFGLFLLTDKCLMFGEFGTAAFAAPTLSLTRSEIISPPMSFCTLHLDDSFISNHNYFNATFMTLGLRSHGINDFDAIVANLMIFISKLPEGYLTTLACLFVITVTTASKWSIECLLKTSLLDSCWKLVATFFWYSGSWE